MKTKTGTKTFLIEVKSKKETIALVKSARKKPENYRKELQTWIRNNCKWEAASRVAKTRGWEFKILTEEQLG
jgi:inorganic pyrophosphatase